MSNPLLPAGATLAQDDKLGCQVLTLAAKSGTARIALQGATVLSFIPATGPSAGRDLLWLSPKTSGAEGKAIRGGIPICGPWFGPNPVLSTAPVHGLLRIRPWTIDCVKTLEDGSLRAKLSVVVPAAKELGWAHNAAASLVLVVGETLNLELSVRNTGSSPFILTNAFHTYFSVSDVRQARVEGLSDREYVDFTGGGVRRRHGQGDVVLKQESAHFFLSSAPVRLVDAGGKRAITLRGSGFAAIPVWNPWEGAVTKIADIGEEWSKFICVENANIPDVGVALAPSMSHHLSVVMGAEAL